MINSKLNKVKQNLVLELKIKWIIQISLHPLSASNRGSKVHLVETHKSSRGIQAALPFSTVLVAIRRSVLVMEAGRLMLASE